VFISSKSFDRERPCRRLRRAKERVSTENAATVALAKKLNLVS
jgi:hypothetical protein